jgi:hyperosmotically inducible protein
MRSVLMIGILAASTAVSGLAYQKTKVKSGHHDDVFTSGPADESQIAKEVRHRLLMLPYYSVFDDLAFQVNGGVVTLTGACPPEPPWNIKSDAANVIKDVPGVTQVINNIRELPMSSMDWDIRRAVAQAIYGNPDIGMRYGYQALPPIHIIVENGKVTLEGVVDNQFDDTLIRTKVNSVPNVFAVTDNLVVANKGKDKK